MQSRSKTSCVRRDTPLGERCQRLALLGEDHREETRRLGRAGVSGNLVSRAWLLVEHLSSRVGFLVALIRNLRDDRTFEHVGEHEAGVTMGRARAAWRIVHV